MQILYDHQIFSATRFGGISKYYVELMLHLQLIDNTTWKLLCEYSNNENLNGLSSLHVKPFFSNVNFKGKARLNILINTLFSQRNIRKTEFDVFHPTYYDEYFLPYLKNRPFVITCHDLIHEKFGDHYSYLKKDVMQRKGKKNILERADKIISVSESTKKDIIEFYGIVPEKIKVIYLAHEQGENISSEVELEVKSPYLLYVGLRTGYKNFKFFITAISEVLKKYPNIVLVCAGGGNFTKQEYILFDQLKITKRLVYQPLHSANLPTIYQQALAFFFPSLYEGFGIPVLEAFSNSCPAVLSNRGSLPEIGQEAALYFDPTNKESIIHIATNIIEDATLRMQLKEKGPKRANSFSWKKTAIQTYEVYKDIC